MTTPDSPDDYFILGKGNIHGEHWRRYWKILRLFDAASDLKIAAAIRRAKQAASRIPPQAILLAAVEVPGRESDLANVIAAISGSTHHKLTVAITPMAPVGKFDNINTALAGHDLARYDWLLIVDDDIDVPDGFLDLLLYFAYTCCLQLSQPAHRFLSHASFRVTERHWGSLVRRTGFVEIGPISLLRRDTFAELLPFPSLRWAWGLDFFWADVAKRNGWKIGVVDAVPIRHLRPVGRSYDGSAARAEAVEFLTARGVTISRADMLETSRRIV